MSEFRRILMSSFLMLLLRFTAADVKGDSHIVKVGGEVTLSFENVLHDQDECNSTTWLFSDSRSKAAVPLFEKGKIHKDPTAKSDRLRVLKNCSLVIKKVTEEDAGFYSCRQFRSGQQQGPDSEVDLSVVTMTEHQHNDEVTLHCSVKSERCRVSVKWLYQGTDVDKANRGMRTSESPCYASVTFPTSHYGYTSRSNLFRCAVTAGGNVQTFSLQSSGEDTKAATTESNIRSGFTTTASGNTDDPAKLQGLLRPIIVSVALAALIISVVTVSIWTRAADCR
ncbi:uncharacterized protein LOC134876538 isoform X2 [Eleginops maclovinus]|uniref:uncharacterized protein LOC134876538 isoform X2 n=1 Tax=Eleginops maclovinus TaxID=56733 RepID=UPI00308023BD